MANVHKIAQWWLNNKNIVNRKYIIENMETGLHVFSSLQAIRRSIERGVLYQKMSSMKKIYLSVFCIGIWLTSIGSLTLAYADILQSYAQQLYENAGFPRKNYARKTLTDQAPYDSIYIDVDTKEFYSMIRKKDEEFKVDIEGVIEKKDTNTSIGIQNFKGKLSLRGNISETCGKPSFKIK